MVPGRSSSIFSWVCAIGAGIAVATGWYGVATTLALASVLSEIEGFGEALGATFDTYFVRRSKDE